MSTTITPATLTVTITEDIELNGLPINSSNVVQLININEIDKRIMTVPMAVEVPIISFSSAVVAYGTFVRGDLEYMRITNKDSVNYARLRVKKAGASTFDTRLEAGQSFMMGKALENASSSGAAFATYQDADSINMQGFITDIDIEYFVASSNL